MVMSMISNLISAWFSFLLPSYATFKVLSQNPLREQDLRKWLMYWAVIGAFMAFEYSTEWLISWFPFYWELKTLFLLFLSLPQTQGSTYIYKSFLEPLFFSNQAELDAGILSLQNNTLAFIQEKLRLLWALVSRQNAPTSGASGAPGSSSRLSWVPANFWQAYQSSGLNFLASTSSQTPPPPASRHSSYESDRSSTSFKPAPSFPIPQPS